VLVFRRGGRDWKVQSPSCNQISIRETWKQDEPIVSATTGIAAKLIQGSTIDSRCHFRKCAGSNSDNDLDDLDDLNYTPISGYVENRWTHCRFLIIDEVSMLGCRKLFRISQTLRRLKNCTLPFGGLFVLFSGDFQQLKPVKDTCLFIDTSCKQKKGRRPHEGFLLWKQVVKRTVILTQAYRAIDPSVQEVLNRVRSGETTAHDIDMIRRRISIHPDGPDMNNC
jgi:PIF1-like helicase